MCVNKFWTLLLTKSTRKRFDFGDSESDVKLYKSLLARQQNCFLGNFVAQFVPKLESNNDVVNGVGL